MARHAIHTDGGNKEYIIVTKGDKLINIAKELIDDGRDVNGYKQLAAINDIPDPNKIYVGQKIYIGATSDGSSSSNSGKPTVNHFGEQSDADNTLFATWKWDQNNTDKYRVSWTYSTGDGVWFVGKNQDISVDEITPSLSKQDTYTIPNNAKQVKFTVKPIAKGTTKNDKTTYPWTASWSDEQVWTHSESKAIAEIKPSGISANLDPDNKYKILTSVDTVAQDLIDEGATHLEFQIKKSDSTKQVACQLVKIVNGSASYSFEVAVANKYVVRYRAYKSSMKIYSEWSDFTNEIATLPAVPSGLKIVSATLKDGVRLTWKAAAAAKSYDIEYATEKHLFDISDKTSTVTDIETTERIVSVSSTDGVEYFFRVRAVNDAGESKWSGIKSVVVGKKPSAPTTWSSTTTATTGDKVTLYWVHNSEDGSSQVGANVKVTVDGKTTTSYIENSTDEDIRDKTSSTDITASGSVIKWQIQTKGITNEFGDWSVERTIKVSAPPTLQLSMETKDGTDISVLSGFPFYVKATAGPSPQIPISYHISITSNEIYETVDRLGNDKIVNTGELMYSKHFDTNQNPLNVAFSAENVDLENNVNYTVKCVVTMDSGLTAERSWPFTVTWADTLYAPNAEIGFDNDTLTASIRPYCEDTAIKIRKVTKSNDTYIETVTDIGAVYGEQVAGAITDKGRPVYEGVTGEGEDVYYTLVETKTKITNAYLSVYRREFDGTFTELATGLDSAKSTTITDPHPALDYARYRIIATDKTTGAVSYYDPPGLPIDCNAIIIQWDEAWSKFDTDETAPLEQPPWSGSMLKLPYNIDVSENVSPDVSKIAYIGRSNPVSYYGTLVGQTASWSVVVKRDDVDTIYALRRLAVWMGDVYVREPSGVGYWANISVSFSQKHGELTIPVSLEIVRVEGGA